MITELQIERIINEYYQGSDKFLVEAKVKGANQVSVFIDGDNGITIDDCKDLTRYIESKIDRDWEDFDLTVSSAGANKPIRLPRQYLKHIGRVLEVKTKEGDIVKGKLVKAQMIMALNWSTSLKKNKQKKQIQY